MLDNKCEDETPSHSSLLRLPPEIRIIIWAYLFQHSVATWKDFRNPDRSMSSFLYKLQLPESWNVLRTCKLFYKEGIDIFWASLTVDLIGMGHSRVNDFAQQEYWNDTGRMKNLRLDIDGLYFHPMACVHALDLSRPDGGRRLQRLSVVEVPPWIPNQSRLLAAEYSLNRYITVWIELKNQWKVQIFEWLSSPLGDTDFEVMKRWASDILEKFGLDEDPTFALTHDNRLSMSLSA